MTTSPDTVRRLRPVRTAGPDEKPDDGGPVDGPAGPDGAAGDPTARPGGADLLAGSPALTVATALLTEGLRPEQVRHLVATACQLAEHVCQSLQATVAGYGDDVAADCALNLAKLLCAEALTAPSGPGTGPGPAPPRATLRLVPRDGG